MKNAKFSVPGFKIINMFVILALLLIGGVEPNPGPGEDNLPQSVPELYNMLSDLFNTRINETIAAVKEVKGDIADIRGNIAEIRDKMDNVSTDLHDAQGQISSLEANNEELKARVDHLENETRKNNVIIFGLPDVSDNELTMDTVMSFTQNNLKVNLPESDIATCYRLGKNKGKRPIFITLNSYKSKLELMKSAPKLKGTKMSISDDLTPKARAAKRLLLKCAHEAREKKFTAKIRGRTLDVNGQIFTPEMLKHNSWLRDLSSARDLGGKKRPRSNNSSMEEDEHFEETTSQSSSLDKDTQPAASVSETAHSSNSPVITAAVAGPSSGNMKAPSLPPSQHTARKDEGAEEKERDRSSSRNRGKKKQK